MCPTKVKKTKTKYILKKSNKVIAIINITTNAE